MAYAEPLDDGVEVEDRPLMRIDLNWGLLIVLAFCLAFWATVIATVTEIV